jgi:predicted CXXCH cytochrome family protein
VRRSKIFLLALLLACGCSRRAPAPSPAAFVGRAACARCHEAEDRAWRGSQHDLAMQVADDSTVLGDFHDASYRYGDVTTRFYRRDGRFLVRTDGPDGALAEFEIRYTFGVDPLQQYLVQFPGGRLQAFGIAWDTRPRSQGGQRWFHLYPGQRVTHDDELHWTRGAQNWNLQCAACHSTDLHKNYEAASRTYDTKWSELNVACEACHGPGSLHVAWAERAKARGGARAATAAEMGFQIALDERRGVNWARGAGGLPRRSAPRSTRNEIEACARCHSSRTRLFDDDPPGTPLLASHLPSLLTPGQYRADGQVEGEVYEYGSFLQSRMEHEGVTCGDCHEPHGLTLRAQGNALCLQCHDGARYDTPAHHHHPSGTAAAACVTCHMPSHTFMVVDVRHDHSLRVPRPDLSDSLGTPNVCASCHSDRTAAWAAQRVREWSGKAPEGFQRFAGALASARSGRPGAAARLVELAADAAQPAIARATAVAALGDGPYEAPVATLRRALADADPLARLGAVQAAAHLPPESRWEVLAPALQDSVRVIRALAAGALAEVPADRVPAESRAALERATSEYLAGETENADQPFAQVNLGNFHLARGDAARAEQAFRAAIDLDPDWIPAYVNLADLLRASNRDAEGENVLRAGLARHPEAASLHHALGLLQVRQKRMKEALASLARAAALAPDDARFAYVYAVALLNAGRTRDALAETERALGRHAGDRDLTELWIRLQSGSSTP